MTDDEARELLQKKFKTEVERIRWWLSIQAGDIELPNRNADDIDEAFYRKISWRSHHDYGDSVVVRFIETEHEEYPYEESGYLTTIPGCEEPADIGASVHIPHTTGEKCDAGPIWMTLAELAINPEIEAVIIGT